MSKLSIGVFLSTLAIAVGALAQPNQEHPLEVGVNIVVEFILFGEPGVEPVVINRPRERGDIPMPSGSPWSCSYRSRENVGGVSPSVSTWVKCEHESGAGAELFDFCATEAASDLRHASVFLDDRRHGGRIQVRVICATLPSRN